MKGFASNLSISVVSLLVALAAAYAILAPQDFALKGFAWGTMALAAIALSVAFVVRRSPRSIGQVLDDVDHEAGTLPVRAPALASRRKGTP